MGEIRVDPAALRQVSSSASAVASGIRDATSQVISALAAVSPAAPHHTGEAVERFRNSWSAGLAALAGDVGGLARSLDAAASLYEQTDQAAAASLAAGWGP